MKKAIQARGLENTILVSILLFLFNLIFPIHDSAILAVINELLVYATIYFLYSYIHHFLQTKTDSPLSLILNAGILTALIFFIISILNAVLGSSPGNNEGLGFFNSLLSVFLTFVFITAIVYIFSTFRELFFLRQKKDPGTYFNAMLVFFSLSYFSNILTKFDSNLDYPHDAFYVVTIVLISINSIRVAWIAFLPKKQKYYLLLISIVLSILFGVTYAMVIQSNILRQTLYTFSPGLHSIFSLVMIYGTIYCGVIFFTTLFHLPTAEAFDRKADEVSSMMDLTKLITRVFDFKELADTVTTMTTRVCNSDSAWLVTKTAGGIEVTSIHNVGYVDADEVSKSILGSGENDYDSIEVIQYDNIRSSITLNGQEFKSIAVAPLKVHDKIIGHLFAARQKENTYDIDERKAVQAFADYAAVALENAKLISESIEKERMEKELDVARDIQRKILPLSLPISDNLAISALFVPAFEVGGDYYDFFELDEDMLGFVVADVAGKGISAAFIMSEVKGIFKSLANMISNPRDLLVKANEVLKGSLDKRNFVTAVFGVIDKRTGKLNIARAGHTPLLHYSCGIMTRLQPAGIGLGLDYTSNFSNSLKEMEIQLKNNDIIVCYSDGIPEAKNSSEEDFGYERLESIIIQSCDSNLDIISKNIMKELSVFTQDHSQHDDITLVLFKWIQKI